MTARAPLLARVQRRVDGLARRMVNEFVAEIPVYRSLPVEQLDGEVLHLCAVNLHALLRCLEEERLPGQDELAESRASAARRAEERVPLSAVLNAYLIGARICWEALVKEAAEEEREQLTDLVTLILGYLRAVTVVVTESWVEEQQAIVGEERDARRALTEAILSGAEASSGLAERAGVRPADRYRAVALRFARSPDETVAGVSVAVAGRRKVRRVVQALEELLGGPALVLLDAHGGAAALPLEDLGDLHASVSEAARCEVWLAHSDLNRLPALPSAWEEVREVRRLVAMLGRPPGVYTVRDVILEYTIVSDKAAIGRLEGILSPIAEREDLIETLDAWFDADFDRQVAARSLSIHPNTLDYRLRRISETVGHDVSSATGMQLLGAALIARRLGS